MNHEEFLRQLELLLRDIPKEEREEAMAFYRSYFEDAGEGNESQIVAELESPQKVAEAIKKDLETEGGNSAGAAGMGNAPAVPKRDAEYYKNLNETMNQLNHEKQQKQKNSSGNTALWVVLLVVTSPIWLTILVILASILLGLVCGIIGIVFGILMAAIGVLIGGIALVGAGIGSLFTGRWIAALLFLGVGFLLAAIGVLLALLVVWLIGGFIPWMCRGIAKLWNKSPKKEMRG